MKVFKKILIANRGEIAVRIIKSAKKLGIQTVAIYSEVDRNALHVKKADEAYCIGIQELSETYLNIEKIIDAAKKSESDAIHPGYGFLAENPLFVAACEKAGIVFIGPHTQAIKLMGNKIASREFVAKLGIPMTQAITGSPKELLKKASKIPLPILVKAAAGGGGKGMRIVRDLKNLEEILESTSREAKNYFGDESVFIEKYVEEPRHIEIQILGDTHGNVVHLFERECTIQRRYQKIIEESPSPTLTPDIRAKMGNAAVNIAKAVDYNSAGTVEFLVDKDLNFYFLEMNTRIQVEHPVTEMVTDVDLVEEQILVAQGSQLRLKQKDLKQTGHAIECRIYAEDPANNFMPSPGKMTFYKQPEGENIRVDSGIEKAVEIQSFFDPMIAKQVVWADNREIAIEKSITALREFIVQGIKTNIGYLLGMLMHKAFSTNKLSTKFCDEHTEDILAEVAKNKQKVGTTYPILAYALYTLNHEKKLNPKNIWEQIGYWRNIMAIPFGMNETDHLLTIKNMNNSTLQVLFDEEPFSLELESVDENRINFSANQASFQAYISTSEKGVGLISMKGFNFEVIRKDVLNEKTEFLSGGSSSNEKNLFAPMPGKIIKVNVKAGDKVKRGTVLLVVEAMKMENNIVAENDAVIEKVTVNEGDMVDSDVQLVFLENTKN